MILRNENNLNNGKCYYKVIDNVFKIKKLLKMYKIK